MPLPLTISVFERGTNGVPTTTFVTDLIGRIGSYTHTITAAFGFESMQVSMRATKDEAQAWIDPTCLMRSVVVTGPDGQTVWEGFVTTIEATFGQEQRAVSLAAMANKVRAKYTNFAGTPGVITPVSDATSIALYGTKETVLSQSYVGSDAATIMAGARLAQSAYPTMGPTTHIGSGDLGDITLTITCAGWYATFDWLFATYTAGLSNPAFWPVITEHVKTLTTAYVATNNFFSTSYGDIVSAGSSADTTAVADGTTYKQKLESMLTRGANISGAYKRLAWGIYEDRAWKISIWAGDSPTTITYRRYLGDGLVYGSGGQIVAPWDVRPDAMYEVVDLLDVAPVATAADAAARFYVQRVTCRVQGNQIGVDLEPIDSNALELRFPGWGKR